MIQTGRFLEFARSFISTINQEREEKASWEFYLHRVFEISYEDFVAENKRGRADQEMSKKQVETTVTESLAILKKFTPKEG